MCICMHEAYVDFQLTHNSTYPSHSISQLAAICPVTVTSELHFLQLAVCRFPMMVTGCKYERFCRLMIDATSRVCRSRMQYHFVRQNHGSTIVDGPEIFTRKGGV